jgi:phosphoribosylformylglycinamidine synthase
MPLEKRVHETIREIVRARLVDSAHDLGEGGLAVAIAESSFGPAAIGADITLDSELAPEYLLFHEAPSRILLSTSDPEKIFSICLRNNVPLMTIGVTLEARVTIRNRDLILIDQPLSDLRDPWRNGLEHLLSHQLPQELVTV